MKGVILPQRVEQKIGESQAAYCQGYSDEQVNNTIEQCFHRLNAILY